jgi:uncharacterized protein (TIGR02996 family)
MSERDAILSAILADPTDDLARLVYADWLEETSQPVAMARARFIRLQIELARSDSHSEHFPRRDFDTRQEIDSLASRWMRAWLTELPDSVAAEVWKQRLGVSAFRRGFVDGVRLPPKGFLDNAPALFAAAPVTAAHFHGGYSDINALLTSPHLRRLYSVRFSGSWDGNRIVRRLAKCVDLGDVRELDLSGCGLRDIGALYLARAESLRNLSVLLLRTNKLTSYGIGVIADAPILSSLVSLDVTGNLDVRPWPESLRWRYRGKLVF